MSLAYSSLFVLTDLMVLIFILKKINNEMNPSIQISIHWTINQKRSIYDSIKFNLKQNIRRQNTRNCLSLFTIFFYSEWFRFRYIAITLWFSIIWLKRKMSPIQREKINVSWNHHHHRLFFSFSFREFTLLIHIQFKPIQNQILAWK